MQAGLNTLNNIGSNYYVRLNEKEILIYEQDPLRKTDAADDKRSLKEQEKKESSKGSNSTDELSDDEKRLVKDLQSRDAEVRTHESAHQAAGGGMTGAATFTYQQGPDGKMYAIGGEVPVSIPSGSSPQERISNARQAIAAAMAPSDPSSQDFAVASSATVMLTKAQQQLAKEAQEEITGKETYKNSSNSFNKENNTGFDVSA